jgi:hypothetical protein
MAYIAVTTSFLQTVRVDIATPTLASCRTVNIDAEYSGEIHWALLLVVVTEKCARESRFMQLYPFTTLLC